MLAKLGKQALALHKTTDIIPGAKISRCEGKQRINFTSRGGRLLTITKILPCSLSHVGAKGENIGSANTHLGGANPDFKCR